MSKANSFDTIMKRSYRLERRSAILSIMTVLCPQMIMKTLVVPTEDAEDDPMLIQDGDQYRLMNHEEFTSLMNPIYIGPTDYLTFHQSPTCSLRFNLPPLLHDSYLNLLLYIKIILNRKVSPNLADFAQNLGTSLGLNQIFLSDLISDLTDNDDLYWQDFFPGKYITGVSRNDETNCWNVSIEDREHVFAVRN